jgi:hypothetical protein
MSEPRKKHKKEKKQKKQKQKQKQKKDKKHKKDKKKKRDKDRRSSSSSPITTTTIIIEPTIPVEDRISEDDYFRRGPSFRMWLCQAKHVDFEDLETIKARSHFSEFVQLWNGDQLASSITAPSSASLRGVPRTKFAWGIKTSMQEQYKLDTLRDDISSSTNKRKLGPSGPAGPPTKKKTSTADTHRNLVLARGKAAAAEEDAKMARFRKEMGLE